MNADDSTDHREIRELLGAYVLGSLNGQERPRLRAHLDGCPACRAEIADIAPLAEPLRQVDPDALSLTPARLQTSGIGSSGASAKNETWFRPAPAAPTDAAPCVGRAA